MRFSHWLPLLSLAASALAGCGPAHDDDAAAFVIGTGDSAFQEVDAGATLPIVHGSQGGIHVWIGGRCRGITDPVLVEFGVRDAESGESLSYLDLRQKVHPESGDDWDELYGLAARLRHDDASLYTGRHVVVWAHLTDDEGTEVEDEIEATLQ